MWTDAPPSVYLYVVALGIILLTSLSLSTIGKKHYPPGPKALPIIGNILSIPQDAAWKVYAEWSQKFGDIIYLRVFRSHIIVINSVSIARELLENRGAIYSSRPWVPMAGDVIGWSWSLPLLPYGETFKRHRKYTQLFFSRSRLPQFYAFQRREAYRLINDVLDAPENYKEHVQRMAGAVVMALVYGHDARKHDDWLLQIASKGARTIESVGPVGAHLVDLIPILRFIPDWFPGAGFKRLPPGTREALSDMRFVPYNYVKEKMAMGTAVDCYVTELLEMTKSQDEEGVRDTAANNYSAGSDTTTALLISAILALTVNPIIQARLQAELDTVVGKDRLPDFSDKDNLPYLQCVISEAIRWGAVTPIGVPHTSVQDDVYDGMYIPKGTTIIANAWAMLHDPQTYPEPESFNPDRFLTGEGRTPPPDPRTPLFGFGRRQCPGKDTSGNTIFIALATLFHVFKFSPMTDEEGNPIPIDVNPFEHSVRHPKPFLCKIRPRRPESISLIRSVQDF
ncbi:cytochrome P450 [Cristinia sonorae]|uniref:Cytochrome P450 n=1 Tax=Cristinia sonorae TaxID=1940300 RepID=A0A8K0XQW7_9AGAR|nr:cytochrome P450 [Cristinia sonorae]